MIMVRYLDAAAGLFAGMMAALACAVLGFLVFGAAPVAAPQRDPVARFEMAVVSPPKSNADPAVYQPIRERLEQAELFAAIGHSTLPALGRFAAFTGGTTGSRADRGMTGSYGDAPLLDVPEPGPDERFRSEEAAMSPTMPHSGDLGGAQVTAPTELSVALRTIPHSNGDTGRTGPEHYLQGGYFAYRENAVGLSEKLANAGLSVLMEQTTNRSGKTRWLVLVGPYQQKKDAMRARSSAPKLLAGAFHTIHNN